MEKTIQTQKFSNTNMKQQIATQQAYTESITNKFNILKEQAKAQLDLILKDQSRLK